MGATPAASFVKSVKACKVVAVACVVAVVNVIVVGAVAAAETRFHFEKLVCAKKLYFLTAVLSASASLF